MSRDLPRLVLIKLSSTYGSGLMENARRLEFLLNEYCGFHEQEVQALVNAVQYGWVERLITKAGGTHDISLYKHLSYEMGLKTGMDEDLALWTVSTWAEVLQEIGQISQPYSEPIILSPVSFLDTQLPIRNVETVSNNLQEKKPDKTSIEESIQKQIPSVPLIINDQQVMAKVRPKIKLKQPVQREKRRLERIPMSYYFRVFERWRRKSVIGHLVDANSQGLMLISEQPIKTDKVFRMKLSFPVRKDIVSVEFDAKSLWNKHDIMMDGYFDTGFLLTDISQKDLNRIEAAFKLFGLRPFDD